jgi:predicted transcriptional regulator
MVSLTDIYNHSISAELTISNITKASKQAVRSNDPLKRVVEIMAEESAEVLPVIAAGNTIAGQISYKEILNTYYQYVAENRKQNTQISLKRRRLKIAARGRSRAKS